MKNGNKSFGDFGEKAAEKFLIQKGYEIIEKNYRANVAYRQYPEIDIIAEFKPHGGVVELVFIEVKTRKTDGFGAASLAVGRKKQANIIAAAKRFIYENGDDYANYPVAFDVIEIYPRSDKILVNHIRHAFIT